MAQPHSLPLVFDQPERPRKRQALGPQATLLAGFAQDQAGGLVAALEGICRVSPFRHMTTPGGWTMSVAMTNCGVAGWVTDLSGYRYDTIDPQTGQPWPAMPAAFTALAANAAAAGGFTGFIPDACLINQYRPGARLSLHQDRDESDLSFPVVSVSLGLPAVFLWGGLKRNERFTRIPLLHGDVVVWGGVDRLRFHAVLRLADGAHPLTGAFRYNLTFRKAR